MTSSAASSATRLRWWPTCRANDEDRDLRGDITAAESLLDDIGRLVPLDMS